MEAPSTTGYSIICSSCIQLPHVFPLALVHSFRLSLLSHHRYICRCHNIHLICYIAVLARVCVGPRSMNVAWGSVRYEDLIFVYIIFRRSYLIHSISFVHGIFRESESSMAFVLSLLCVSIHFHTLSFVHGIFRIIRSRLWHSFRPTLHICCLPHYGNR